MEFGDAFGQSGGGKTLASNAEANATNEGDIFNSPLINKAPIYNASNTLIFVAGGLVGLFLLVKLIGKK